MSNPTYPSVIPAPPDLVPIADSRGVCTQPWYRFFLTLFQRTGGSGGIIIPSDLAVLSTMNDDELVQFVDYMRISLAASTPQDPSQLTLGQVLATSTPADCASCQAFIASLLAYATNNSTNEQVLPLYLTTAQDPIQEDPMAQALFVATEDEPQNPPLPVVPVALDASPAQWTAPTDGTLILTGGTVTLIEISRDAAGTFIDTGLIAGPIPVKRNDIVQVTYAVAPTAQNFLPG